jgi:LmbE family N-acetylglucosaminyl deacetylase
MMAEKLYTQADLEELLDKAHEAALPHAAEQLFKALTEGGEFAVSSPLDKAKKRVEELLREEREKFVVIVRRLTTYVDAYGPRDHINGAATKKLVKDARALTGQEKARAISGDK